MPGSSQKIMRTPEIDTLDFHTLHKKQQGLAKNTHVSEGLHSQGDSFSEQV